MGDDRGILLSRFPHVSFFAKSALLFVAILGGLQVLAGWWKPAEVARVYVYDHIWAAPIIFVGFYAVHLVHECRLRAYRLEIERRRSEPAQPRKRAAIQKARQQRVRNQQRR